MESQPPTTKKEVQQLTGRLAALGQFISRFTDLLKPFFITLKGSKHAGWDTECDQVLMEIKQYFTEPPILASLECHAPTLAWAKRGARHGTGTP